MIGMFTIFKIMFKWGKNAVKAANLVYVIKEIENYHLEWQEISSQFSLNKVNDLAHQEWSDDILLSLFKLIGKFKGEELLCLNAVEKLATFEMEETNYMNFLTMDKLNFPLPLLWSYITILVLISTALIEVERVYDMLPICGMWQKYSVSILV